MSTFEEQKAYAISKINVAEIQLPAGVPIVAKVKTNSTLTQKVTIHIPHSCKVGDATNFQTQATGHFEFSGTGERSDIGHQKFILDGYKSFTATFEFAGADGIYRPSRALNNGGPYDIGAYHIFIVVAENGDDSDYNDAIVEFSWYTPKQ